MDRLYYLNGCKYILENRLDEQGPRKGEALNQLCKWHLQLGGLKNTFETEEERVAFINEIAEEIYKIENDIFKDKGKEKIDKALKFFLVSLVLFVVCFIVLSFIKGY